MTQISINEITKNQKLTAFGVKKCGECGKLIPNRKQCAVCNLVLCDECVKHDNHFNYCSSCRRDGK